MTIILRNMTEADLPQVKALTQQLQWPHRLSDLQQMLQLGEGTVIVDGARVLGSAMGWRWGDRIASLGVVIVAEALRGQGYGRQLMRNMLARFSDCQVRLHATEMGRGLYEKLGFVVTGQVMQHQTRQLDDVAAPLLPAGWQLRAGENGDLAALTALDYQASGMVRTRLLTRLLTDASLRVLLDEQQQMRGFAVTRRFGHGHTVGPLLATDEASAKRLVSDALCRLAGEFVRLDTPVSRFSTWLTECGLTKVDSPVAMIHGTPWQPQGAQTFGLMSQAMA